MKNSLSIKKLVGLASLAALVVVLQLLSNYIQFGPVSITLALIPMVVGAILYGPAAGFGLGALMGVIILTAPSTATFFSFNAFATIILCIFKTGLAGLAAGWLYKGIIRIKALGKAKFPVAIIVATLVAPIINTCLFIIGTAILFRGLSFTDSASIVVELIPSTGDFGAAFSAAVGFVVFTNFIIEFSVSVVLSPSIVYLFRILGEKYDLGFAKDFKDFSNKEILNN
ncbi:MAG: ECF transporter S component [Anaeroplasma sp.]